MQKDSKELRVPAMGESVSEAILARWLHPLGSSVTQDEPVAELETDKVTLEVPAPGSGILSQILVPTGTTVAVGTLLGVITPHGANSPPPKRVEELVMPPVFPAAQKIANDHGIDVQNLEGTGKGGRITKGDVLHVLKEQEPKAPPPSKPQERVPMSTLRQKIAERLKDAQTTAAILTTFNEVDVGRILAMRTKFKELFLEKYGVTLGLMSFFVKACTTALKAFPKMNATIQDNDIVFHHYYDIGVAVGTPQGLVVPVLKGTDQMTFAQIETQISHAASQAREGTLTIDDLAGGTFTISNGGVYGSLLSTPILNPPQSAILGMHKIQKRPVVIGDNIEIRPMMYLALSYDHRLIDGQDAVSFLVCIKENLEDPERLMLAL